MRIVSLLPSATEIVHAVGLGDRLVGVSHECDHPAAVRGLPRGATTRRVLFAVGQPDARVGDTFTYCARKASGARTKVTLDFSPAGRLVRLR